MSFELFPAEQRAVFSPDGTYRYVLRRTWLPLCASILFIGVNPSKAGRDEFFGRTAEGDDLDQTCRREIALAKAWKYGTWLKGNLFGLVSTDPRGLRSVADPIGPENDAHLVLMIRAAHAIVCCWGNNVKLASPDGQRARDVMRMIREHARDGIEPMCFKITKEKHVEHSLYQRSDVRLMRVPENLYG